MAYRHLAWFRREAQHVLDQVLVNYQGNELMLLGHDNLVPIAASPVKHCFSMLNTQQAKIACLTEYEQLPLPHECLDIAVIWHALDQSERPVLILKELKRVLRPDGLLVVMGVNPWRSTARYVSSKQHLVEVDHTQFNTMTTLQNAAHEVGFSIDKIHAFAGVARFGGQLQGVLNDGVCRYTKRLALGYCMVLKPQDSIPLTPLGQMWRKPKFSAVKTSTSAQCKGYKIVKGKQK